MGHRHQRGEAVFGGPVIRLVESANLSGVASGAPTQVHRAGIGALKLRFAWNFIGSPALTREESTRREQITSASISVKMSASTGQYLPSRLVNIGANRWGLGPEIGISEPYGNWFFDPSAGVRLFMPSGNQDENGASVRMRGLV